MANNNRCACAAPGDGDDDKELGKRLLKAIALGIGVATVATILGPIAGPAVAVVTALANGEDPGSAT